MYATSEVYNRGTRENNRNISAQQVGSSKLTEYVVGLDGSGGCLRLFEMTEGQKIPTPEVRASHPFAESASNLAFTVWFRF